MIQTLLFLSIACGCVCVCVRACVRVRACVLVCVLKLHGKLVEFACIRVPGVACVCIMWSYGVEINEESGVTTRIGPDSNLYRRGEKRLCAHTLSMKRINK